MHSAGYRSAVAAPVHVAGRLWGVLAAASTSDDPLPEGIEQRLGDFAELVAQALANADAYASWPPRARGSWRSATPSGSGSSATSTTARSSAWSVALELSMVARRLDTDPDGAREMLTIAQADLAQGLSELRELARGIHPVVLTERGLARRWMPSDARPVPVEVTTLPDERLAAPVEAAMYYVVAESITNVAKYAHASSASVSIARENGVATVTVSDDGIGGATRQADRGSAGSRLASRR